MSSVEWAATSPRSAGFSAVGRCSDVQGLSNLHKELRTRGQGYIEVRPPTGEFPLLTMGFRGDHAVIHLFQDTETVSLLVGDGSVAANAVIDVPTMDEEAVHRIFCPECRPCVGPHAVFRRNREVSRSG
ncbi:hypothetical protein AB0919_28830 [Streptomyces sp. NPDC046994]|uniref:hypothetical protein n=1 Tax=Streptomyces sp. NPDC046994 TaxID=3155735 RepID=UPI003452CED1